MRLDHSLNSLFLFVLLNSVSADDQAYIKFSEQALIEGREIWLDSCEGCHAYGIAGSPNPLKPDDWRQRLAKDQAVLYEHAIDGFFGPDDTMMPPRGGNHALSDEEVKVAVDYMTSLAEHYITEEK